MTSRNTDATRTALFRRIYGSHPLHLLLMLAGFGLLGYVVVTAGPSTLWKPEGSWWKSMAVWFVAAIVVHDLVLFPLYALADRLLGSATGRLRPSRAAAVPAVNYLRVPALGSGLLFLIFFPGIVRQGATLFYEDTGLTQQPFLGRWLLLTGVMFGLSAVAYGIRLATHAGRRAGARAN